MTDRSIGITMTHNLNLVLTDEEQLRLNEIIDASLKQARENMLDTDVGDDVCEDRYLRQLLDVETLLSIQMKLQG